jgi:hypothetical protein
MSAISPAPCSRNARLAARRSATGDHEVGGTQVGMVIVAFVVPLEPS